MRSHATQLERIKRALDLLANSTGNHNLLDYNIGQLEDDMNKLRAEMGHLIDDAMAKRINYVNRARREGNPNFKPRKVAGGNDGGNG